VFYTTGLTKNLSLKRSFVKQFLHALLTEFHKTLFVFAFQKRFLKKFDNVLIFSLLQINIFLVFLDHFDMLISKIIFLK